MSQLIAKTVTLLSIALFLTAGCVKFHRQPISPEQTAAAFENRTLDNTKLKEFLEKNLHHPILPWPPSSWEFQTLTLAAFYYHPDLDVARAKWGVREAAIITAGVRPNPSVQVSPGTISNAAAGVSPWLLSLSLDIPVETAGKRGYRIAQATHLSEAARLNIAVAAWQIRSRLRTSLLDLYTTTETEAVLKKQLVVQEEIVKLLGKRLRLGEISRPELTQANISLRQTRLSLYETQKEISENRARVAQALGLPLRALAGIDLSFDFLGQPLPDLPAPDVQRQALLNRPDILSGLSEYEAAQSALQVEIAKQYPNINLNPAYELEESLNKWFLGFSIPLPVFDRNQGPIAEAEGRRKEASARFTALQASVIGEIERVTEGYAKALQKLEEAEALLTIQKKREQSARAAFDSGETDRLAFASARLELHSMALSRLRASYDARQALGLIEDAIQKPLGPFQMSPNEAEISPVIEKEKDK
jgi:outer membrane protein, heavy metal efflux system